MRLIGLHVSVYHRLLASRTQLNRCIKQSLSIIISKKLIDLKITVASLALIDDQDVVWSQSFGFVDKENEILALPDTIFKIGITEGHGTDKLDRGDQKVLSF